MFLLYFLEDRILLRPDQLNKSKTIYEEIVLEIIREKYLGKILMNHGIAVSIKKLILKNNLIVETEGVINIDYECELIIFKPVEGDILYGKIIKTNEDYITLDCELVKVRVPKTKLMEDSHFEDNVWCWNFGEHKFYYDIEEEVRVKVIDIHFNQGDNPDNIIEVVGAFNQEGLGPLIWWK